MSIALHIGHIDMLDYVEQAEKLGVPQELAKFQARKLDEAIETAITALNKNIKFKDLATKGDIQKDIKEVQKEIKELELRLLKWQIGIGISTIIIGLSGTFTMLKLMLHV